VASFGPRHSFPYGAPLKCVKCFVWSRAALHKKQKLVEHLQVRKLHPETFSANILQLGQRASPSVFINNIASARPFPMFSIQAVHETPTEWLCPHVEQKGLEHFLQCSLPRRPFFCYYIHFTTTYTNNFFLFCLFFSKFFNTF